MRGYARLTVCEGKQLRFGGGRLGLDQTSVQWEEGTCEGGVRGACEGRARGVSGVSHARLSGSKWTSDLVESGGDTRGCGPIRRCHVEVACEGDVAVTVHANIPGFCYFSLFFFAKTCKIHNFCIRTPFLTFFICTHR